MRCFELSCALCFVVMPQMPHEICLMSFFFLVMLALSSVLMTAIGASFIPANSTKDMLEAKKKFENTLVQIYVVEDGNDLQGLARFAPCKWKD